MDFTEKQISRQEIFKGGIFEVARDIIETPDGKEAVRDCVFHNGGVCVVALTDKNEILFVRQYRYPCKVNTLELPAGKLEKDEDPDKAIIRELEEETGASAEKIVKIAECFSTPGFCSEKLHIYFATGLSFGKQHLDDDEFLDFLKIPVEEAVKMAQNGEFKDLKTFAGILYFAAFLNK